MNHQRISLPDSSPLLQKDFTFGVATAAFQIEGAAESRLTNIWDTFCAQPGTIRDGSDGLIACDHYRLWLQDLELIRSLGVDAYRFSVAWGRVINADGSPNLQGLDFYIRILDTLNEMGIKAFVTLYHWDLPQFLEDQGGWLNRQTVYHFQEYAELLSKTLGDRVYSYATLNEPYCSAYLGYEVGIHAPGKTGRKNGLQAAHHLLLAHGLALQVLQKNSPSSLNGIVLNFSPCYAKTDSEADLRATRNADDYFNQWYLQPVISGRYPEVIELIAVEDRPQVEAGDMDIISQPLDYLGINYYTREHYCYSENELFEQVLPRPLPHTDMGWEVYPQGLTDLLVDYHNRYELPPIYITENGAAMADVVEDGMVNDHDRIAYLHTHINAVHNAVIQGVDVKGYFAWSLMDNFEWAEGYLKRFGIVYVDYETQQRILKKSAEAYKDLLAGRPHVTNGQEG